MKAENIQKANQLVNKFEEFSNYVKKIDEGQIVLMTAYNHGSACSNLNCQIRPSSSCTIIFRQQLIEYLNKIKIKLAEIGADVSELKITKTFGENDG
jgi:hypothetical protein